jgi:hypothetical protein
MLVTRVDPFIAKETQFSLTAEGNTVDLGAGTKARHDLDWYAVLQSHCNGVALTFHDGYLL